MASDHGAQPQQRCKELRSGCCYQTFGAFCLDLPTNGFAIKPLTVKLSAGEQKATEEHGIVTRTGPRPSEARRCACRYLRPVARMQLGVKRKRRKSLPARGTQSMQTPLGTC